MAYLTLLMLPVAVALTTDDPKRRRVAIKVLRTLIPRRHGRKSDK